MQNLLPSNVKDFFHYEGSYTTPNCKEAVVWTVFKEPITITSQQVDHRPISGCATLATVALFSHSCTYLTLIRNELTAMTDGRPLSTFNTTHKLLQNDHVSFDKLTTTNICRYANQLTFWRPLLPYGLMGTAIKHPVSDRVKPSFVIFDIRALWRLALSVRVHGCQKSQMTGLTRSGTRHTMVVPMWQLVGVKVLMFLYTSQHTSYI